MLTVILGCVASGNSSTRNPFPSVYSVTPSTVGPWSMPAGTVAPGLVDTRARGRARQAIERAESMARTLGQTKPNQRDVAGDAEGSGDSRVQRRDKPDAGAGSG